MPEKYSSFYELINAWIGGAFTTLLAAMAGRAMWHSREARKGHRKFIGPELLWEFPFVLGMVLVGEGLASYLAIGQPASTGLIAALAYLGPRGLEVWLSRWWARKEG